MFEAKAREYFKGACHHFLVSATEVPETVQLVLTKELFIQYSMSKVRSEHKVNFLWKYDMTSYRSSPNKDMCIMQNGLEYHISYGLLNGLDSVNYMTTTYVFKNCFYM